MDINERKFLKIYHHNIPVSVEKSKEKFSFYEKKKESSTRLRVKTKVDKNYYKR